MGKGKKKEDLKLKAVDVEFNVSMYCNACERTVAKVISKFKGVETFTTDMNKHKVKVRGRIDAKKLMKKLKKKTKKRVEIVEKGKEKEEKSSKVEEGREVIVPPEELAQQVSRPSFFECCKDYDLLMKFSDENPNACSIM